jgi:Flp pilus assembly protein TadD
MGPARKLSAMSLALCWAFAAPASGALTTPAVSRMASSGARKTEGERLGPPVVKQPDGEAREACVPDATADGIEHRYERYGKTSPGVLVVLGGEKAREGDAYQASQIFRALLDLQPGNLGAELGLAHALSAQGCYAGAAREFNDALKESPENYDALQGKAFALLWAGQDRQAKAIFRTLVRRRPADPANRTALGRIARIDDLARWKALAPAPGAPARAVLGYELSYLADHPPDITALSRLVAAAGALGDDGAAIEALRRALRESPGNRDFEMELADALAWNRQYAASIALLRRLRQAFPDDPAALAMLAKVYDWSGHPRHSLAIEKELVADQPSDSDALLAVAMLEVRLKEDGDARRCLEGVLKIDSGNRGAWLTLAQLDLKAGQLENARSAYEDVLGNDFNDPVALFGEARIDYYLGRLHAAQPLAARLVSERPTDFDALMLLARIDRAFGKRASARRLLQRAALLKPGDPEVTKLRNEMSWKSSVRVQTSASYTREISQFSSFQTIEDMSTYGSSTRVSLDFLPHSSSYILSAFVPVNSPLGGSLGQAAPLEFLYGQATRVSNRLVIRGGLGATRLGPGYEFSVGNPVTLARTLSVAPAGYAGWTLNLTHRFSFDAAWAHSAVISTPIAARFGVTRTRLSGALSYRSGARTRLRASFFHDQLFSSVYHGAYDVHSPGELASNGSDVANGGRLDFTQSLIRSRHFSFDAGYSGLGFGYAGQARGRGVFMGVFNPPFYQSHFFTTRCYGALWRRLRYDLIADFGGQQIGEGQPFSPAYRVGPGLIFEVDHNLAIKASYLHYNFMQSLGKTLGNAVQISTDYRF